MDDAAIPLGAQPCAPTDWLTTAVVASYPAREMRARHEQHARRTAARSGTASVAQFARLDHHRRERTGIPEVVLADGKTPEQVVSILISLTEKSGQALATRASKESTALVRRQLGKRYRVESNALGRTIVTRRHDYAPEQTGGRVAVLAAGTADVAVAEEARVTAEVMGCEVLRFYDVGIAGIHRLAEPLQHIQDREVACVVVAAGMEGALPSVVRGLVSVPVIGVPVSTGYGHGGRGEGALMTMLQSCSPGLTVVNFDNGFGAGATAALIANRVAAAKQHVGTKKRR
jgi:NCAIR mutase (PurE)-related protein